MRREELKHILADLRCLTPFPRRYGQPQGEPELFWRGVVRRYNNTKKVLESSDYHWRIIEYNDGHKELAYLRVLKDGVLSGARQGIYRGPLIPHRISYGTFANIKAIRLAF